MDFVKADSTNLPVVVNIMILEYMASNDCHNVAEIRGAKALLSSRASYLDSAVGFVEIHRTVHKCTVRAQIVPEHRIRLKNYTVIAQIGEQDNTILASECDGCAAAAGGCKHSLLLLYWLERKFSEPATTEVKCYWAKPKLKDEKQRTVLVEDLYKINKKNRLTLGQKKPELFTKFLTECKKHNVRNSLIYLYCGEDEKISYNLFDLALVFITKVNDHSFESFHKYINNLINNEIKEYIKANTTLQADSKLWHSIRQGRLTGSKIYEASVCNTDGALVQQILGGYKVPETAAIRRGKILEKIIIKQLEQELNCKIQESGIILIDGLMGASPDGLCEDFVIEIKCPSKETTIKNYVKDNQINKKFLSQIHLQMLAAGKNKGLFCVANPDYETSKIIHKFWINYDKSMVDILIEKALIFWKNMIFPKIITSAKAGCDSE